MTERFHVDADREGDICIVDENGLTAARLVRGDKDGERYQLATARLLAAAGDLADTLSLALTWITDPGATDGREAVELRINAALDAAVDE